MKTMLPYIPRDMRHTQQDSRAVVSNVLSYFKREAKQKKLGCHVRKVICRTSCAAGLPKDNVRPCHDADVQLCRIINDDMGMCVLRRQILFYCANYEQPPTLNIVRDMIKEQFNIACTKSSALIILNKLGFHFSHLPGCNTRVLLEDSGEASKRLEFLRKLRDYRNEGREIVYVGGTVFPLRVSPTSSPQRERSLLLIHAGYLAELLPLKSMFKFETVDSSRRADGDIFQTWFTYQLIPFLPKDSVVVFVNISSLIEPRRTGAAEDDLWPENVVEESGHVALRVPRYLADLNPMEKVWQTLNDRIAESKSRVVTLKTVEDATRTGSLYRVLMRAWTQHLAETQEMEDALLEWSQKIQNRVEDLLSGKTVPNADSDDSDADDVDAKSAEESENRVVVPTGESTEELVDLTQEGNASSRAGVTCRGNTESTVARSTLAPFDDRVAARLRDFDWICSEVDPSVWRDVACLVSEVVERPDTPV